MTLFTTCPDKFGNSSRQTDPQLFFNHWWLISEDRTLGLFVISTLHSSSFNMSVQQCVMCQLQKLNEPDNTALALQRNWFVSQLSIASKTALTSVSHKPHVWLKFNFYFLFIHQKLALSAEKYTQRLFSFKDLVFLCKCFRFWPRGYWQFKVLLFSFRNILVAYKGDNYSCVNQILHYYLFLDLRISFPLAVIWHK